MAIDIAIDNDLKGALLRMQYSTATFQCGRSQWPIMATENRSLRVRRIDRGESVFTYANPEQNAICQSQNRPRGAQGLFPTLFYKIKFLS